VLGGLRPPAGGSLPTTTVVPQGIPYGAVVAAVVGAFGTRGAPKRFNWGTPSECCAS